MVRAFFVFGAFKVSVSHLLLHKGVYYYYRRIPEELRPHYGGKLHIRKSLRTRDLHIAAKKVAALAAADDALWASWRSREGRELGLTLVQNREAAKALLSALELAPGDAHVRLPDGVPDYGDILDDFFEARYGREYMEVRHDFYSSREDVEAFYTPVEREAVRLVMEDPKQRRFLLSDALEVYLKHHDKGQEAKFVADTRRAIQHVFNAVGDLPLPHYRREQANAVRDFLVAQGNKTATVRRRLNTVKAVYNSGLLEFDLGNIGNPFSKLKIVGEGQDADEREPFTPEELHQIANACRAKDDDIRHVVALMFDTGARLGEIVGLRIEDVLLDHAVPHIHIRFHEKLGRTLKTDVSERTVPLVGMALWAAGRALASAKCEATGWLFPRYASDEAIEATHASNTVNKWLRNVTKTKKTSHSFRHTMRDRLRHADVPEAIQDEIGGWGKRTVGMGYGEGYGLRKLKEYLSRIVLS